MDAPFRTNFDAAIDQLTARNALGILDGGPMPNGTVKMRTTAGAGAPENVTFLNAILALSAVRPAFRAHKNGTDQTTIAANTTTQVTFGTENYDVGSYYDTANSRWTPPAGTVLLDTVIHFSNTAMAAGDLVTVQLYKNGNLYRLPSQLTLYGSVTGVLGGSAIDIANGTDYYEIWVIMGGVTAGNKTVFGGSSLITSFSGVVL